MRVAVVGGLARQAADCVWNYPDIDVTHYNAEEVRRVVESAVRGGTEAVILVTRFISHETEAKVRKTGVKTIRWDQGLKELSRKLPTLVNGITVNGQPKNTNGAVNVPKITEPAERSWVERISDVLKLDTSKAWTTREIMDELHLGVGKQPRVSEAIVKLRAQGRARSFYVGREKSHRWVPDNEMEAAKAEFRAETTTDAPERLETQAEALVATGHVLPFDLAPPSEAAPKAPPAAPAVPEDHAADLGTIFARARLAKRRAAGVVAALEAELKVARAALAKAESDESGALAMLDDMASEP